MTLAKPYFGADRASVKGDVSRILGVREQAWAGSEVTRGILCRGVLSLRPPYVQQISCGGLFVYKFIPVLLSTLFTVSVANAQAPAKPAPAAPAAADCTAKAVGKDGRPLAGAAKSAFMKKCEADAGGGRKEDSGCADKAIDKNGKALSGAAKTAFLKKCETDAKGAK